MARYYAAVVEMPDGSPSRVEHATSGSEVTAARAALRLSNTQHCTALVVERSTIDLAFVRVTQRIQYFGKRQVIAVDPRD